MTTDAQKRIIDELTNYQQLRRLKMAVIVCIHESFAEDRARKSIILLNEQKPPETEVRRRATICYDWFKTLRGDLHYSFEKAVDFLPRALRSTLDRDDWVPPPAERSWSPTGS